ncbi:MAG: hypothetical protein ACREAZ_05145, partial [Nitrososphaera sp.]
LWIDARGPAQSIEEAVSVFGNAAGSITPIIAFSTNAAIANLEPELAYNNTPGLPTRDFLQSMLPDERSLVHVGRTVRIDSTCSLFDAIEKKYLFTGFF